MYNTRGERKITMYGVANQGRSEHEIVPPTESAKAREEQEQEGKKPCCCSRQVAICIIVLAAGGMVTLWATLPITDYLLRFSHWV
jgi:hypothetical protein